MRKLVVAAALGRLRQRVRRADVAAPAAARGAQASTASVRMADGPGTNDPFHRIVPDNTLAVGLTFFQIVNAQSPSSRGERYDTTGRNLYGP